MSPGSPAGLDWELFSRWMLSGEEGARTPLRVATAPELGGVTGRYFIRRRDMPSSRRRGDRRLQGRV